MHEEPQVPNFGEPGKGPELEEGMVLAIEPMVNVGGPLVRMDEDGWSVFSEDDSLAAHFEFTVAVTADGPRSPHALARSRAEARAPSPPGPSLVSRAWIKRRLRRLTRLWRRRCCRTTRCCRRRSMRRRRQGCRAIQVSPPQGRLLQMLARLQGARTVLEFGTLGGYSTILLARALPDGGRADHAGGESELTPRWRAASIERAGLGEVVDLRVGPALETLPALEDEGVGPFDLTFIDADKVNTPDYFAWALDHSRPGSLIVADNVVRGGSLGRSRSATTRDPGPAPPARDARRRASGHRHDHPDCRLQGLRRLPVALVL